ncbi:MAG: hypothetical protein IKO65_09770 [Victivallales bacterium]|nr:hypothetical protein [Victivallales bacterium]
MHNKIGEVLLPLFWQHGEEFSVLVREIAAMQEAHCDGFIVESRPFPAYLEQPWWETLTFLCEEAARRKMTVWVFDDRHFPTGFVGGRLAAERPDLLRQLFHCREWPLKSPLAVGEEVLFLVEYATSGGRLREETAVLQESPPMSCAPGHQSFAIVRTTEGGEEHTRTCLNYLVPEAVDFLLKTIYESHFQHLRKFVGTTFRGFFSDEPRFGNVPCYDAILGHGDFPLPYSASLFDQLSNELGEDCRPLLPLLWRKGFTDAECRIRTAFMDLVSNLFASNFSARVGEWCRKHGLQHIGHIVEDNGAHCRLGYGPGHYFRSQRGQIWAGVDSVLRQQVRSHENGFRQTQFGQYDDRFFHWGLAKLASSCAHLDTEMTGAFVELFGAYGWQEDVQEMKAMVDHFLVRGVNRFVPHAFSPKEFPDPDCPPHFYAHGRNPQWRFIPEFFRYLHDAAALLSRGRSVCRIAVLYHAENEWCGRAAEPFEAVAPVLARNQLDFDVVDMDYLQTAKTARSAIHIGDAEYRMLVVPGSTWMPPESQKQLSRLLHNGVPVVFHRRFPDNLAKELREQIPQPFDDTALVAAAFAHGAEDFQCSRPAPTLRVLHRHCQDEELYFLYNESLTRMVRSSFTVPVPGEGYFYDSMQQRTYSCRGELRLEPEQAVFLRIPRPALSLSIACAWPMDFRTIRQVQPICENPPAQPEHFVGVLRYRAAFDLTPLQWRRYWLLLPRSCQAVVRLNGVELPPCFASPHRVEITNLLRLGKNEMRLELATTLVRKFPSVFEDDWQPVTPLLDGPTKIQVSQDTTPNCCVTRFS